MKLCWFMRHAHAFLYKIKLVFWHGLFVSAHWIVDSTDVHYGWCILPYKYYGLTVSIPRSAGWKHTSGSFRNAAHCRKCDYYSTTSHFILIIKYKLTRWVSSIQFPWNCVSLRKIGVVYSSHQAIVVNYINFRVYCD